MLLFSGRSGEGGGGGGRLRRGQISDLWSPIKWNVSRLDWLKSLIGKEVVSCQMFCGYEGRFTPLHYDLADNLFVQVHGWKRVLLFHPRQFLTHPHNLCSKLYSLRESRQPRNVDG